MTAPKLLATRTQRELPDQPKTPAHLVKAWEEIAKGVDLPRFDFGMPTFTLGHQFYKRHDIRGKRKAYEEATYAADFSLEVDLPKTAFRFKDINSFAQWDGKSKGGLIRKVLSARTTNLYGNAYPAGTPVGEIVHDLTRLSDAARMDTEHAFQMADQRWCTVAVVADDEVFELLRSGWNVIQFEDGVVSDWDMDLWLSSHDDSVYRDL